MNTHFAIRTLGFGLLALAGTSVFAQDAQKDFPAEHNAPRTCADFKWHPDMLSEHPRVVDACQEAVVTDGIVYARLQARFVRVERDGGVRFDVHDSRDRNIDEVTIRPEPEQVAYIDDKPTPFERLRPSDALSLYVPEGEYGYATRPGERQVARYVRPVQDEVDTQEPVADTEPMQSTPRETAPVVMAQTSLPRTASNLPWLALTGGLSLFGALSLNLLRRR